MEVRTGKFQSLWLFWERSVIWYGFSSAYTERCSERDHSFHQQLLGVFIHICKALGYQMTVYIKSKLQSNTHTTHIHIDPHTQTVFFSYNFLYHSRYFPSCFELLQVERTGK